MTIDQLTAAQVAYTDPIPFRDLSVTSASTDGATKKTTAYNFSNVANVLHFGALNDGTAGAATGINAAIDYVSGLGGGTVNVPGGTYTVSGVGSDRINLKSNVHLVFGGGVAINSGQHTGTSLILAINTAVESAIENVTVSGNGVVITGNSTSTFVQYGIALNTQTSGDTLRNVVIRDVVIKDVRTDGITVGGNGTAFPEDVIVENVTSDNSYRNGGSVIQGKRVRFVNCTFKNTDGASPKAGFDIEPDTGLAVEDVTFSGCTFNDNGGNGLYVQAGNGTVTRIRVEDCYAYGNVERGIVMSGISYPIITGSRSRANANDGIYVVGATQAVVSGCISSSNTGFGFISASNSGIAISGCSAFSNTSNGFSLTSGATIAGTTTVTGCSAYGNSNRGFSLSYGHDIHLVGCYSALNASDGIQLYQSQGCTINGCTIEGNVQSGDLNGDNIIVESNSNFNHIHGNTVRQSSRFFAGTATAGGSTTVTLPATRNTTYDDFYNGMTIRVLSGTGSGQTKTISDYVAATGVVTVSSAWSTNPDGTSVVQITLAARPRYGIRLNNDCNLNKVTDNDCFYAGGTGSFSDAGVGTVTASANRT